MFRALVIGASAQTLDCRVIEELALNSGEVVVQRSLSAIPSTHQLVNLLHSFGIHLLFLDAECLWDVMPLLTSVAQEARPIVIGYGQVPTGVAPDRCPGVAGWILPRSSI